jgi:hypothetical protein
VMSWADGMGWVGGVVAAVAYVLVSRGRMAPDSARFHGLNVAAAAMLAVAAFDRTALPSACMNVLWILFGLGSLAAAARAGRRLPAPLDPAGAAADDRARCVETAAA